MPIKVLIAEDSSFQRSLISKMIDEDLDIEVIAQARNGNEAVDFVEKYQPDVLLLDLVMPEKDGLEAFKLIMKKNPLPIIIFSVLDLKSMDTSVKVLLLGAFDYIIKPGGIWKVELPKFKNELISKIKLASKSKVTKSVSANKEKSKKASEEKVEKKEISAITPIEKPIKDLKSELKPTSNLDKLEFNIVVIGTSVGGPKTLKSILKKIPKDFPCPILIVQHLDSHFMNIFAQSLNKLCEIEVKVAENGEKILPGKVYLSPGNQHMEIIVKQKKPCIRTFEGERINFVIPSADVLFESAAKIFKNRAMGVILTGLGRDGAAGLKSIKEAGGETIAESPETCVVYGMPKIAIESNAANLVVPNYNIKNHMIRFAK